jgi:hypothetical protein
MRARGGVDQLGCNPDTIGRLAHTALEHITHAEMAADLLDAYRSPLEADGRAACDDEQPFDARQPGDDVFHHALAEIILLGIAAQIRKRKHRHRGPVGQCERGRHLSIFRDAMAGLDRWPDIAIATPRQRLDPASASGLLENPAQGGDLNRQIAVLNRKARPRGLDKRVF